MGYHPRIEAKKVATFQTTRARSSELWFVNNRRLEEAILGYAARYTERYGVKLYALAIEGNHIQFPAHFPKGNRAQYMRDFNSAVARAVPRYQKSYPGGRLWGRRYSAEYLPGAEDVEDLFFYTVLQPVQDGLVDSIYDYPGYNCFEDAINGRARPYKVIRWKEYHDALRWDPSLKPTDFADIVELKYTRLPGYEDLSTKEYVKVMREKLALRTSEIIASREGKKSLGRAKLTRVTPGSRPQKTKTSALTSHRPRVLSKDPERRAQGKAWYFCIYFEYRAASELYRAGELHTEFPPGTYRPPIFTCSNNQSIV